MRATWQGRAAPFTLSEVLAEPAPTHAEPPRSQLEVSGQAAADKPDEYEFDFSSRAPVDRVNIKLPQTNTYAHIVLASRDRSDAPWRMVVTTSVYELQGDSQPIRNAAIPISNTAAQIRVGNATAASLKELGGPDRLVAKRELPWKAWLLWAALIITVRFSRPLRIGCWSRRYSRSSSSAIAGVMPYCFHTRHGVFYRGRSRFLLVEPVEDPRRRVVSPLARGSHADADAPLQKGGQRLVADHACYRTQGE